MPSVLLSLISTKNVGINIFIIFDPPLIFAFLVLSDHIPLVVTYSYLIYVSPGMSLVALICIFSSISMSFLIYGLHDYNILSEVLLLLYTGVQSNSFLNYAIFLRIIPITWLPLDAAIPHCSKTFMLAFIDTPK